MEVFHFVYIQLGCTSFSFTHAEARISLLLFHGDGNLFIDAPVASSISLQNVQRQWISDLIVPLINLVKNGVVAQCPAHVLSVALALKESALKLGMI